MRNVETREIDGIRITVQQLGGRMAAKLFVKLSSHVFPALGEAGETLGKLDSLSGADVGQVAVGLSKAAKTLFEKLTPDEFDSLASQLLETARVVGPKGDLPLWPQWDDLMAGKVLTQFKVLAFALEVNFRDFLPALGAAKAAMAAGAKESNSLNGPSGV